MKKWQKVLIVVLVVFVVIGGVGTGIYKMVVEPKLEQALEKAQKILDDENVQAEVDKFVKDMIDTGVLNESDVDGYMKYKNGEMPEQSEPSPDPQESADTTGNATENEPTQKPSEQKSVQNTPSQSKNEPEIDTSKATGQKRQSLMLRVRKAMTAEEFAFAMAMYSKIDTGYVLANINTNRAEVKQYIKSKLTSAEISRSLEIYGKYSYLLSE